MSLYFISNGKNNNCQFEFEHLKTILVDEKGFFFESSATHNYNRLDGSKINKIANREIEI